jgi:hypothetical protein
MNCNVHRNAFEPDFENGFHSHILHPHCSFGDQQMMWHLWKYSHFYMLSLLWNYKIQIQIILLLSKTYKELQYRQDEINIKSIHGRRWIHLVLKIKFFYLNHYWDSSKQSGARRQHYPGYKQTISGSHYAIFDQHGISFRTNTSTTIIISICFLWKMLWTF